VEINVEQSDENTTNTVANNDTTLNNVVNLNSKKVMKKNAKVVAVDSEIILKIDELVEMNFEQVLGDAVTAGYPGDFDVVLDGLRDCVKPELDDIVGEQCDRNDHYFQYVDVAIREQFSEYKKPTVEQRVVITPDGWAFTNIKDFDGKLTKVFGSSYLCYLADSTENIVNGMMVFMIKGGNARVLVYDDKSLYPVQQLFGTTKLDDYQIIEVGISNNEFYFISQNDVKKDKYSEFEKSCYDFDVSIGILQPWEIDNDFKLVDSFKAA